MSNLSGNSEAVNVSRVGDEGLELSQESPKITALLVKALRYALRDELE